MLITLFPRLVPAATGGAVPGSCDRQRNPARSIRLWRGLLEARACLTERPTRVLVLTVLIALLSLADLHITLTYLSSVGMSEANPVARLVMSYNSAAVLIGWKLATIVLSSLIFFVARRRPIAEVGCWLCMLVMVWLTHRWLTYSVEVSKVTPVVHTLAAGECATWVRLDGRD